MRQALFNSIQSLIPDARILDLFAGSGALGFEALSRGAESVVFVESNRVARDLIEKNAKELGVSDRVRVIDEALIGKPNSAGKPLRAIWPLLHPHLPFDLVLADPPYGGGWERLLIEELPWNELLVPDGCFCLEWGIQKSVEYREGTLPEQTPWLVKVREKNYGDSVLTSYRSLERGSE